MCKEQSGIYQIVLYENVDLTVIRDSEGNIESILNNGLVLSFTECENLLLDYIDKETHGKNDVITHEYSLNFSLFGFSTAYEQLDQLASIFGFIPAIYFRNDTIKAILSPLFKNESVKYAENNTQVYPLVMSSLVPTFEILQNFVGITPDWVLETGIWGGSDTLWTADGIWNTV